jgi:hypothetical protein
MRGRLSTIAHLNDTDINVRTKEIMIRQKPCSHCKDCISEGNVWKMATLTDICFARSPSRERNGIERSDS